MDAATDEVSSFYLRCSLGSINLCESTALLLSRDSHRHGQMEIAFCAPSHEAWSGSTFHHHWEVTKTIWLAITLFPCKLLSVAYGLCTSILLNIQFTVILQHMNLSQYHTSGNKAMAYRITANRHWHCLGLKVQKPKCERTNYTTEKRYTTNVTERHGWLAEQRPNRTTNPTAYW